MTERHERASKARMTTDHDDLEHGELNRGGPLATQWIALLLAPVVFLVHLQVGYVMVPWACNHDGVLWIHVAGALSVLLSLVGNWVAWRLWGAVRREGPGEAADLPSRARFIAVSGLATGLVMTLVLAVQWVYAFLISPCQ